MTWIVCSPAYGRDYKSAAKALEDWKAGKDFTHEPSGRMISVRDCKPGDSVELRYCQLRKLTVIKIK